MKALPFNAHRTAINRKNPSLPLRTLIEKNVIKKEHKILDFGCGKGADLLWLTHKEFCASGYDPYWFPNNKALNNKYNVVLCSYVLNVVDVSTRVKIINELKQLTLSNGSIYITVRRDLKKDYISKVGTHQYIVKLPYPIVKETSAYCIYEIKV